MAEAKYLRFIAKIPEGYNEDERTAIAQEIIDYIAKRTSEGIDAKGKEFPKYSKSYQNSLDYKNAGKKPGMTPDLVLSGDMLAAMRLLDNQSTARKLAIGYLASDPEAGRVEGNVRGTYGASKGSKAKARNFLGISEDELGKILSKYPLDNDTKREKNTAKKLAAIDTSQNQDVNSDEESN